MVPSIAVMPRDGSFALAFFGRMRKVQESAFSLSAGRKSFAHLRGVIDRIALFGRCAVHLTHKVKVRLPNGSYFRHYTPNIKHSFVGSIGWLDFITSPCEVLTQKG